MSNKHRKDLYIAWYQGIPCNQYAIKGRKPNILFDSAFKKVHKKTLHDRHRINMQIMLLLKYHKI